jgi:SAM-dependent methyltransferase
MLRFHSHVEEHLYREIFELEDRHWWFRGRRAVIWALLRRAGPAPSPRILDAGCGTGRNLIEFGQLGPAHGIDPSPQAIDFCRRRGLEAVREARIEAIPFASESFDLILTCDVLEHTDDDLAALVELHRVAAPNALLLLTVPAYQWLWSEHDEVNHHRRRYARHELVEKTARLGWREIHATYFNSALLPPIAVVRRLRGRRSDGRHDLHLSPRALDRVLVQPMRVVAALMARGVRLRAGVSIGLVGRRG